MTSPPASSHVTISEQSQACLNSFHYSLSACRDHTAYERTQNQLVRFNIWASNIAALSSNHRSLDYRLRDAPDIRSLVVQLLAILQANLQHSIGFNKVPASDQVQSSSDRDSAPSSSSSSSSASELISKSQGTSEQILVHTNPFFKAWAAVEATIDRLQRLSVAIRKSAALNRNVKAANFTERDEEGNDLSHAFELYATRIVQHRYKDASEGLCKILGASMSLRRRRFMYLKRHQQKLASQKSKIAKPKRVPDIVDPQRLDAGMESVSLESVVLPKAEGSAVARSNLFSHTTASALDPKRFNFDTASSRQSSFKSGSVSQDVKLEFPPPPKALDGVKEFECPYCWLILPVEEAKIAHRWRKHVMEDLEPYVCVFEGCTKPVQLFRTTKEWLNHIQWEHDLQWVCTAPVHSPQTFDRKEDFERHMRHDHLDTFTESQLPMLTKGAASPAAHSLAFCPFCYYIPAESELGNEKGAGSLDPLQKHVIGHLKSLAITCLPWQEFVGTPSPSNNSSRRRRSNSTIGSDLPSLKFEDIPIEERKFDYENLTKDDLALQGRGFQTNISKGESIPLSIYSQWCFLPMPSYPAQEDDPVLKSFIERSQIISLFNAVDKDGSGKIYKTMLTVALVNGGWSFFHPTTIRMLLRMFGNGSGHEDSLDFDQFKALWDFLMSWRAIFKRFRGDKDQLSFYDFQDALTAFGYRLRPQFVESYFNSFAPRNSKSMTFDIFVQSCVQLKRMTEKFKQFDDDRDGYISLNFEEFLHVVMKYSSEMRYG